MSSSSRLSPAPRALIAALLLPLSCFAQTAVDLNEGLSLQTVPGAPGAYAMSWWGRAGRTYFLQRSTDLTSPWEYFPVIEAGADAPISYGFTSESPKVFVRLRIVDQTFADPYALDSDVDGLTNQQEFALHTDPFSVDTDGDGLSDKWETDHGLDPRDPTDAFADADGDGRSAAQEFLEGTDPLVADSSPASFGAERSAPGLPVVELLSPTSARLTWSGSTGGLMLGYLIERSEDNLTWTLIGFTTGTTTTYNDTKLIPGTAYSYRLKGVY